MPCCRTSRRKGLEPKLDGHEPTLQEYCASLGAGRRGSVQPAAAMLYPMYVVRVPEVLRMAEVRPHQALLAQGIVEEYNPTLGVAVFVSHQWCSRRHPDPDFDQFAILQGLLRRIGGDLKIQMDLISWVLWNTKPTVRKKDLLPIATGFVWYDYFSVPQPSAPMAESGHHTDLAADMGKAVFSIPAYVEACRFFVILAPPVDHADIPERTLDYHSWKERGWCRLERFARVLSPRETHMLLAWKEDSLFQVGCTEYLVDAVGDGVFSVDDDRARLAPVMRTLMENKLQALLQQNDIRGYRRMLATRATILRRLPGIQPHEVCAPGFKVSAPSSANGKEALDAFLRLYGMRSANDRAGGTTDSILFAARDGNVAVVEALLECRANVRAREGADDAEYMVLRDNRPLHVAALYNSDPAVVKLLLQHRASLEDRDGKGVVPLLSAAFGGHEAIIAVLLEAGAKVSATMPPGVTALDNAGIFGRERVSAQLIRAGARAAPTREGLSPLVWAILFGAGRPTVEVLLAAPDMDRQRRVSLGWCSPVAMLAAPLSIPRRLWGSNSISSILAYEADGMSPLMLAGLMGRVGEARALIAAGANPAAKNSRGHTAADLAEMAGLHPRTIAYFREPALIDELRHMKASLSEVLERLSAVEEEVAVTAGLSTRSAAMRTRSSAGVVVVAELSSVKVTPSGTVVALMR